jgi:cyclopropane fatty-acyl-phospholipid synthase-like methyltransferase
MDQIQRMKDEIQYQLKKKIELTKKASDYVSLFDKIVSEEKFEHQFPASERDSIIQEVFDYLQKKEVKKYHSTSKAEETPRSRSRHSSRK